MNTEIIAHPTLQHVGIMTPNLDADSVSSKATL